MKGTGDILIRGMEMPKPKLADMVTVYDAYVLVRPNGRAVIVVDNEDGLDSTEYPLVPVPPHGRTIDVAALWVEINKICDRRDEGIISDLTCLQQLLSAVRHAPTIIPAEPCNNLSKPCKEGER